MKRSSCWMFCQGKTILTLASIAFIATLANAQNTRVGPTVVDDSRPFLGEPVTPVEFNGDLRDLPVAPEWQPGDPMKEAAKRQFHEMTEKNPAAPADWITAPDMLIESQARFDALRGPTDLVRAAPGERVTINNNNTGVSPGDPVVDVSPNYVMYGINSSTGTSFTVYDKAGTKLAGPTTFKSLAPAGDPCATSVSDPIIHFDRLANRWFLLEMGGSSTSNRLCTYVSNTENPVSGGWKFYGYATPSVPDYPKCTVWPNAYVCGDNESGAGAKVYAFDRANMLAGTTARAAQRFTSITKLAGYGFQSVLPATFMGSATNAPPANAPIILMRHNDDEAHSGTSADTTKDFLDMYSLNIDWNTPANSGITTLPRINITEFNSWFRDYSSFDTVPQPGSASRLDPIREVLLNSLTYRNLGSYQSIVGTFATNQNASRTGTVVDSGLRWFELQNTGSGWSLRQEGTYSPADGATHHLLGTIASDKQGNIGFGFNVTKTSPALFPSLAYSGRLSTDALGVMTQTETTVATGAAVETSGRWGDYYQMVVDPADDCTFWFVGMYRPSGAWQTRAQNFKFSSCGGPLPSTYSVSGSVTTSAGAGVSGVSVSSGSASGSSDSAGAYSIGGLANGTYTLTPSKSGCTFSPTSRSVTVSSADVSGQAFTATCTTTAVTERLANGNFDTITTSTNSAPDGSWSRTAFTGTSFNTLLAGQTNAFSGGSYAQLGINNSVTQTVESAAVAIPAAATTTTLSFYAQISSSENTTTAVYDRLFVELVDTSNNSVLATLVTLSNLNKGTSYVQRSYNINAYKGKTVKVRLRSTMDSSITSTFRVDNVSLQSN
jgi:hypothetical protein